MELTSKFFVVLQINNYYYIIIMITILIIIIISIIIHKVRLVNDKNFNENTVSSRTYQSLFLQIWNSTIENKNRFYPVIQ